MTGDRGRGQGTGIRLRTAQPQEPEVLTNIAFSLFIFSFLCLLFIFTEMLRPAHKPQRAFAPAREHGGLRHVREVVREELAREVLCAVVYRAVELVLAFVLEEVVTPGKRLGAER